MKRIMGDSTTMTDIPLSVDIACVYANGFLGVVTPAQLERRFPHAYYGHVFVDVNGSRPDVQVRDWEIGDKSGSLEQWVKDHNAHTGKRDAVIYCNKSTIQEVRNLTGSQILGEDYFLFVATLDGTEYTGPGVIACQRDGEDQTHGHWDRSIVYSDHFWRPVSPPSDPGRKHPDCKELQRAVHTEPDNFWGPTTDKHTEALVAAAFGEFPFGVEFAQMVVGTKQDNIWGPKSVNMHRETTRRVQTALDHMGFNVHGSDGFWGPNTRDAFYAARKACHI